MITKLAPLGATHNIVLSLAYGEIPNDKTGRESLAGDQVRNVTVTVHLKPKDGVKGQPRDFQFTGCAADVETELAEKLPVITTRITQHQDQLAKLDEELKAEQEKAQKEHEQKKESAANTVRKGVRSTTTYPAKKSPSKPAKAETAKAKPEAGAPTAAEAAVAAALDQAATPASEAPAAEPDPIAELQRLAEAPDSGDDNIEM
jgi:hypothetical protein